MKHNRQNFKKQTEEWLMRIIESFLVESTDVDEQCKEKLLITRNRLNDKKNALLVLKDVVTGKKYFKGYKETLKPHIAELLSEKNNKKVARRIRKNK